ncbi:MAG: esterase-like activity of phytase family protein [Pseudomonadota bacterium]
MRRFAGLLAALCGFLLSAGCAGASDEAQPSDWRVVDLDASLYQLRGDKPPNEAYAIGALIYRGGLHLTSMEKSFGGYSGVTVSPDGAQLLAVSDRRHWLTAALAYGPDGRLVDADGALVSPVTAVNDEPLAGDQADAEAVFVQGADLFVGFERQNRIDVYRSGADGRIVFHRNAAAFDNQAIPFNKGIEAIAPLDDGRLIAFAEGAPSQDGGVKAWIVDRDGRLSALSYNPAEAFSPTDAMRLPGGDLLVLERAYSAALGARARVVRIHADAIVPGASLEGTELARFSAPLIVDNMEGIAAREDDEGNTLIYLISDDNQNRRRQKTLLLMFELTEDAG